MNHLFSSSRISVSQDTRHFPSQHSTDFTRVQQAYPYCCNDESPARGFSQMDVNQALAQLELKIAEQQKESNLNAWINLSCSVDTRKAMKEEYQPSKRSTRKQFPEKLHAMLAIAGDQGFGSDSHAVSWLPHGRAFVVHDEQVFMESIVPKFSRQTKIRSFYRQLGLWGFTRLVMGHDAGAWYNENFSREAPDKMKEMVRIKIKSKPGISSNSSFDSRKELDLYAAKVAVRRNVSCAEISVSSNEESVQQERSTQVQANQEASVSTDDDVPPSIITPHMEKRIFLCGEQDDLEASLLHIEPIALNEDCPSDEFAEFIDEMIHVVL